MFTPYVIVNSLESSYLIHFSVFTNTIINLKSFDNNITVVRYFWKRDNKVLRHQIINQ